MKYEYVEHPPHKMAGAFGAYIGFTLAEAKRCVKECWEFQALSPEARATAPYKSQLLLGGTSTVSQQLLAFRQHSVKELHAFPDLFCEVQEMCFGTSSDRAMEEQHKRLKVAGTRGLRYCKPAAAAALQRRTQIEAVLEDPKCFDWAAAKWKSRLIFHELLDATKTRAEVDVLSIYRRHACVYFYDAKSRFKATQRDKANVAMLTKVHEVAQMKLSSSYYYDHSYSSPAVRIRTGCHYYYN